MTKHLHAVGVLLLVGSTGITPASAQSGEIIRPGVCHAIDGDTLRCGSVRIRLSGIDAAELPGHCNPGRDCAPGDPYAQWAALKNASAGTLSVYPISTDRFGRIVATVRNSAGQDLSCVMLAAGATYKPHWDNGERIAQVCPDLARN